MGNLEIERFVRSFAIDTHAPQGQSDVQRGELRINTRKRGGTLSIVSLGGARLRKGKQNLKFQNFKNSHIA